MPRRRRIPTVSGWSRCASASDCILVDVVLYLAAQALGFLKVQPRQHDVIASRTGGMHDEAPQSVTAFNNILRDIEVLDTPERNDCVHAIPDTTCERQLFRAEFVTPKPVSERGK